MRLKCGCKFRLEEICEHFLVFDLNGFALWPVHCVLFETKESCKVTLKDYFAPSPSSHSFKQVDQTVRAPTATGSYGIDWL